MFKIKIFFNFMSSEKRGHSFFPGYIKTCDLSHKCETKIEHISLWGKISGHLREQRVVWAEVNRKRSNWHSSSASHWPDMPQRHWCVWSAGHTRNGLLWCVQGVRSYQAAVKTGRLTMRFGRALGNIWASPWSLWHDTPVSKAWRQSAQQSASRWPQAILKGQAWSHLHHSSHFTTQRRHDSQIKAPANYVHHSQACVWR